MPIRAVRAVKSSRAFHSFHDLREHDRLLAALDGAMFADNSAMFRPIPLARLALQLEDVRMPLRIRVDALAPFAGVVGVLPLLLGRTMFHARHPFSTFAAALARSTFWRRKPFRLLYLPLPDSCLM